MNLQPRIDSITAGLKMDIENVYDGLADGYDAHFTDAVSMAENEAVFDWINNTLSGDICDLGCGTGLVLEYLDISTEQYVGVDISRRMLNHAQTKFPDHLFIHADIQGHIPIDDNCFNSILAAFDRYGVDQEFRLFKSRNTYRYLYIGEYRYWHYEIILNRTKADQSLTLHTEDPKPDKQQRTLF